MPSISPIGMPSDEIFGQQVGEHPPHHADRPARVDHILEQPQHLFEDEQHRREHQRAEQRHRDRAGEIAVDEAQLGQIWSSQHHDLAAKAAEIAQRTIVPAARVRPSTDGPYSETVRGFMSKLLRTSDAAAPQGQRAPVDRRTARAAVKRQRPRIALLSNPKSTGNIAQLPRIREYCADHPDVFHYEVEHADQIGEAMRSIARVRPKVLASMAATARSRRR